MDLTQAIDLSQLNYFIRVAELRSISKAATALNVSYSTVSAHISRLEQDCKCSFFEKAGSELLLNDNGRLLYRYAMDISNFSSDSIREISDRNERMDYEVRVSTLATPAVIPLIVEGFKKKYPHIRLRVNQYQNSNQFIDLNSDAIIVPTLSPAISSNSITLYQEAVLLALSNTHPLKKKRLINSSDLAEERFVRRSYRSSLRYMTDSFLQTMGIDPPTALTCDYPPYIREFVANGVGIAFMPALSWHYNKQESISMARINDSEFSRYVNISWPYNGYLSSAASLFVEYTVNYFKSIPSI